MNLYIVENDRTKEDYYVIAADMNEAGDRLIKHLEPIYKSLITIISVKFVACACEDNTPVAFKSQYRLVIK